MRRFLDIPGLGLVVDPDQNPPKTQDELDARIRTYLASRGLLPDPASTSVQSAGQTDAGTASPQPGAQDDDTSTDLQTAATSPVLANSQVQSQQAIQTAQNIETQHQQTEALLAQQALDNAHAAQRAQQAHDALLAQQQHEAQAEALEQQQFLAQQSIHNAQDAQN